MPSNPPPRPPLPNDLPRNGRGKRVVGPQHMRERRAAERVAREQLPQKDEHGRPIVGRRPPA